MKILGSAESAPALISLIVPAYNEEKYIASCLEAALCNADGILNEIIVVDNASTDRTAAIAASFPGVRVVYENNKGLTRARQRGYMEATGDILAYIDADTHMLPGWCAQVQREFHRDTDLACLSGPYEYYDVSPLSAILVKTYWRILAYPMYLVSGFMVVGGNFAIRKTTLVAMGGFDTKIEFYGEDANIGRRAHQFGKVYFKMDLVVSTSARRLHQQGIFSTARKYVLNYLSETVRHLPATREYRDIR